MAQEILEQGPELPENFDKDVEALSNRLMEYAIKSGGMNAVTAVTALAMAAGRACGVSNLRLGLCADVFLTQFTYMRDLIKEPGHVPAPLPEEFKKCLS
jgi:hypothetical protein